MNKQRMQTLAGLLNESKLNEAIDQRKISQIKTAITKAKQNLSTLESEIRNMLKQNNNETLKELKSSLEGLEWIDSQSQKKYSIKEVNYVATYPNQILQSEIDSKSAEKFELKIVVSLHVISNERGRLSSVEKYSLSDILFLLGKAGQF